MCISGEFHLKVCLQLENKVIKSKKSNSHRAAPGVQVKFMESLGFKVGRQRSMYIYIYMPYLSNFLPKPCTRHIEFSTPSDVQLFS